MCVCVCVVDNHDVISMRVYDLDDLPDEDSTDNSEEVILLSLGKGSPHY